jgi:NarL family two-component system response regulator LiaR
MSWATGKRSRKEERHGTRPNQETRRNPGQAASHAAQWAVVRRRHISVREITMTSTAFAPAIQTSSQPRGSIPTELELVSPARMASRLVTVRVLIANEQPIVSHGLRALIANEPNLQVVGETNDGREAVRLARQLRPDVVLIDLSIRTMDGISATRMIRAELRDTQVIVMTGVNEDASAVEAIRAGAVAYFLKDARTEDLLRSVRGAGTGQVVLPAQMAARLARLVGGHDVISHRETEVLRLVAGGLANKQVARQLGITESTVKSHVSGMLSKLGLPSRTQLALYAARTGLVAIDHLGSSATYEVTPSAFGESQPSGPSPRPNSSVNLAGDPFGPRN